MEGLLNEHEETASWFLIPLMLVVRNVLENPSTRGFDAFPRLPLPSDVLVAVLWHSFPPKPCVNCADKYDDGVMAYGGYADYVRMPSAATVFSPLKRQNVKARDRVGVIGNAGFGRLAIQFIHALGAASI
ncbi:hypothetical protein PHYSODRAFT_330682 [Phytophthora sojae]|uniref:Alcohol dehydrogenase-like C-terminal domain-containing protein n=1 Tax=Phytophthora sojae (strain P6497) TaxID=1094619 RepID=G4ZFT6_PHYSP|nr:hypothetical protein PHYSODRAFT_330682 [Phytophthora sojae]EGZ16620.1 hypothetical protein PHYSODRAFT_330682 [Phytophthora sojae]|eukprot:XP_009525678.1 hypothetical protein PHYSODRAFT_330682 [Phytophthora sojae]